VIGRRGRVIPSKFREYARAFYTIAEKDYERAKKAFEKKDYPASLFFSQQCV